MVTAADVLRISGNAKEATRLANVRKIPDLRDIALHTKAKRLHEVAFEVASAAGHRTLARYHRNLASKHEIERNYLAGLGLCPRKNEILRYYSSR